jgi:hypothetical protein
LQAAQEFTASCPLTVRMLGRIGADSSAAIGGRPVSRLGNPQRLLDLRAAAHVVNVGDNGVVSPFAPL